MKSKKKIEERISEIKEWRQKVIDGVETFGESDPDEIEHWDLEIAQLEWVLRSDAPKSRSIDESEVLQIILDPLSHHDDTDYCLIEVDVFNVQSAPHCIQRDAQDEGVEGAVVEVEVATLLIVKQRNCDVHGDPVEKTDGWPNMVGSFQSIIRINEGPWEHAAWGEQVDFIEGPHKEIA